VKYEVEDTVRKKEVFLTAQFQTCIEDVCAFSAYPEEEELLSACAVEWKKERMQEVENEVEDLARLVSYLLSPKLPSNLVTIFSERISPTPASYLFRLRVQDEHLDPDLRPESSTQGTCSLRINRVISAF